MSHGSESSHAYLKLAKMLIALTGNTSIRVTGIESGFQPGYVNVEIKYNRDGQNRTTTVQVDSGYRVGDSLLEDQTLAQIRLNWPENWRMF